MGLNCSLPWILMGALSLRQHSGAKALAFVTSHKLQFQGFPQDCKWLPYQDMDLTDNAPSARE